MSRPSTEAQYLASLLPPSVTATGIGRRSFAQRGAGRGRVPCCVRASGRLWIEWVNPERWRRDPGRVGHADLRLQPVRRRAEAGLCPARHGLQRPQHQGHNQHGRPQHVPGEHQHLSPGAAGRRVHLVRGLQDEVLRRAGPRRRHQRRLAERQRDARRDQGRVHRRRRQAVLHPLHQLPVGDLLPAQRLPGQGLPGAEDPRRTGDPLHADAEGRAHPDRVRRQGRLACDGHVRPAQPAHQRLRLHVSLMAGKEAWDSDKVKKVFDTWNRLLPFHQPDSLGRTWQEAAQSLQQKSRGCTCWACSSASSSRRAPTRTTWTSSRSPANVVGEASRIGFGSAMATIMLLISSIFVAFYVSIVMREERRK